MPSIAKPKAKAKAELKPKRKYRLRDTRVRAPPLAIAARTEQLQRDMLSKPGKYFTCPQCSYPRFLPTSASCSYPCALPRVRVPDGKWVKCDYNTTANAWRRWPQVSHAHATACKAAADAVVTHVEAQCEAGVVAWSRYYEEIRRQFSLRTAPQNLNAPADNPAAMDAPLAVAPDEGVVVAPE